MTNWQTIKFGDLLAEPTRNGIYKPKEFHGHGSKMINMGELFAHPRIQSVEMRRVDLTEKEGQRFSVQDGDLLFARRSLVAEGAGKCSIVLKIDEPTAFESSIIRARLDTHVSHPLFYFYFFSSPQGQHALDTIRRQVAVAGITGSDLVQLSVPAPPLVFQKSVADLLGSLDDKTELNRRMNETLEAMAQAIFRDWFVDFGPTRRKLDGASDPVTIMGGLVTDPDRARELADLFPTRLGDDGLPEGWEERGLDQIADFLNGLALQKFPADDEADSLPVIKIAELRNGITSKSNRASRRLPEKYIVHDGDFLFSWSGSLLAKFWTEGEGALNQHLFKVSSDKFPSWFYSLWVHHHMNEFRQIAASKATTMGHIQRSHLTSAKVVCPTPMQLSGMSILLGPLVERTIHNEKENRHLVATRDLLLPKLMSGEIHLGNIEAKLEAAQ